jgi:hypothetical protein
VKSLLLCVLSFLFVPVVNAQYGVNWPTQPAVPMATDVEPGTQTLRVSGVNDFFYSYDINVVEITTPTAIPALVAGGSTGVCVDPAITAFYNDSQPAFAAYKSFFPTSATSPKSLAATESDWAQNIKSKYIDKLTTDQTSAQMALSKIKTDPPKSDCEGAISAATQVLDMLNKADAKLNNGPHVAQATFTAKSCKSDILTVVEKFNGVPTGQSISVRLDAQCNQLTVSGGVLLSEIQNRTYTSSTSATGSGNVLSVGGTGKFSPTITSLFNFNLPAKPLGDEATRNLGDLRFGISTGPVLQLSSSQATSFGWFAGGTVSLFHLLYLSVGEHFGQFADFPTGFSANQSIPPGFGQLIPEKRWTGRFGFAITLKGWDVSKAISGGAAQPTPTPTPAPPKKP